jgi:hypothetical protein
MCQKGTHFETGSGGLPVRVVLKEARPLSMTLKTVLVEKEVYAYLVFKMRYLWDMIKNKEMCYAYYAHFGGI